MSESLRRALECLDEAIDLLESAAFAAPQPDTYHVPRNNTDTVAALDDLIASVRQMLATDVAAAA